MFILKIRKHNNFKPKLLFDVYKGGKPHREQGVKNGKKFHHQKAERRTCSEEQCRREPAAWGIPLRGKAGFCSQKKEIRFMSSQASLGCKHVASCSLSAGFRLWDKIQ